MIATTPNTPLGPATSALTLGRNRVRDAVPDVVMPAAVLALICVAFPPVPLTWLAAGAVAMALAHGVVTLGAALVAMRALRRCSACRAAEVAATAAEDQMVACRRGRRRGLLAHGRREG